MKTCSHCKVEKEVTEFFKSKATKDGLAYLCKVCSADSVKRWQAKNPEKRKAQRKLSDDKRKEKRQAYQQTEEGKAKRAAYYQRPEVKAKVKAYYQREDVKARARARRERKRNDEDLT